MRLLIALAVFLAVAIALPYNDQMALTNSLIVGRTDDLNDWTCKVCDDSNKPLHAHYIEEPRVDIKCILSVYPEFVVLAFRYTNTLLNVWQDILYPLQVVDAHTCSNCKVQKAYNNMWGTIHDDVINDLKLIQSQTNKTLLYITGISLGGGLAAISYIDIIQKSIFKNIRVITFGAPRVGNKYWAAHFDQITNTTSRRYIVSGDPIVVLPYCLTLLCTYRQTGVKIVCYEKQALCKQEVEVPDPDDEFTDRLARFGRKFQVDSDIKRMRSIMDHVDGYPKIYNFTLEIDPPKAWY